MNSKIDWLTDLPTTFNPLRIRGNASPYFLHYATRARARARVCVCVCVCVRAYKTKDESFNK